jgi:hypothetical protein
VIIEEHQSEGFRGVWPTRVSYTTRDKWSS